MKCDIKYRPIVWKTPHIDRAAMKSAYLEGDGQCPSCAREGRQAAIEERFGETC